MKFWDRNTGEEITDLDAWLAGPLEELPGDPASRQSSDLVYIVRGVRQPGSRGGIECCVCGAEYTEHRPFMAAVQILACGIVGALCTACSRRSDQELRELVMARFIQGAE